MKKSLVALVALFTSVASALAATTLTVTVKDASNNDLVGVYVYAVNWSTNGMSNSSQFLKTVAGGTTGFTLEDNNWYNLMVTSQGYSPTLKEQMEDPEHRGVWANGQSSTEAFTLNTIPASQPVARFVITIASGSSNKTVNVNVNKQGDPAPLGSAFARLDSAGAAVVDIFNVPAPNKLRTYNINAYDPTMNIGVNATSTTYLTDGKAVPIALNFGSTDAMPPDMYGDQSSAAGDYIDGTIQSSYTVGSQYIYIPGARIELEAYKCQQGGSNCSFWWQSGTNADENGRFKFYGLDEGTTYYAKVFSSCARDGSTCFEGFKSTAAAVNPATGANYAPTSNDFLYTGGRLVHKIKLNRAPKGEGKLRIAIKDQLGRPISDAGISLHPDWGGNWHTDPTPYALRTNHFCNVNGDCSAGVGYICVNNACVNPASNSICEKDPWQPANNPPWHWNIDISSPGLSSFNGRVTTGYLVIENLNEGNYGIDVWTQFSKNGTSYNSGPDGLADWGWIHKGCTANSADDLRVFIGTAATITTPDGTLTNSLGDNLFVFNTSGAWQNNISSITVIVNMEISTAANLSGNISFPSQITLTDPIMIMLQGQCSDSGECQAGNYAFMQSTYAAATFPYQIYVATGTYWLNVISNYWGQVREEGGGSGNIQFTTTTNAIVKNFKFAPSGRLTGNVYKPDGNLFKPGQTANGSYLGGGVSANGDNSGNWGQIADNGSYLIGGLLPGNFRIQPQTWGADTIWTAPEPKPEAQITAYTDTTLDIKFAEGAFIRLQASTAALPTVDTGWMQWGVGGERYSGLRMPAGGAFTNEILPILFDDYEGKYFMDYGNPPQGGNQYTCWNANQTRPLGGWCPVLVPTGNTYDFYLTRHGDGKWEGEGQGNCSQGCGTQPYFTILFSSKNVTIDSIKASTEVYSWSGQISTYAAIPLNLTPATTTAQGAVLKGRVYADNIIREQDFKQFGGSIENFFKYLPHLVVYDENKNFIGAAETTPLMAELMPKVHLIDQAFVSNDWTAFHTAMFSPVNFPSGWNYEIRGLPANTKLYAAMSTPNYPPANFNWTTGVDGSTKTWDINFEALGAGGAIYGVVTTTNASSGSCTAGSTCLESALVTIEGVGYPKKKATTSSLGAYRFDGLPAGNYLIHVTASGYTPQRKEQEVPAAGAAAGSAYQVIFPMQVAGNGVIAGSLWTSMSPPTKCANETACDSAYVKAYDETLNVADPNTPLVISKAAAVKGDYTLKGLTRGHLYKVYVVVPGKYVLSVTTAVASVGNTSGVDFLLPEKPADVDMFVKKEDGKYKFLINNPKAFDDGWLWAVKAPNGVFISTAVAYSPDGTSSPEVTSKIVDLPGDKLSLELNANTYDTAASQWVLHIVALYDDGAKTLVKDVLFGTNIANNTKKPMDAEIIGDDDKDDTGKRGNEVCIDATGKNNSAVAFPAGSVINVGTRTIPTIGFTEKSTGTLTGGQAGGTFLGSAYEVNLTSIQFTDRPLEITVQYNKDAVGADLTKPELTYYDSTNQKWTKVDGQVTIDPSKGTVSAKVKTKNSRAFSFGSTSARYGAASAKVAGGQYVYNPLAATGGAGLFAVGVSAAGTGLAASKYVQYNLPNPFNLKPKTVTLINGTGSGIATAISGTYIVAAPTGSGTVNVTIRIYNVAGDLVREITDTATAGFYNYFYWDGKNKSGSEVASGVYFAVVDAPGAPKKEPIKMVVIK
ncbi:MAG: carboxypeptidase regulatory-like domain-containing protein [Elusimicrobia bacterium]|nr:carboxypeptidase regulatory-like domain-containing protein [Elusimicrobiota bacterium]